MSRESGSSSQAGNGFDHPVRGAKASVLHERHCVGLPCPPLEVLSQNKGLCSKWMVSHRRYPGEGSGCGTVCFQPLSQVY